MSYLLDTNVWCEARKREPDRHVAAWFDSVPAGDLHLSVLVVGEIRQGIARLERRDTGRAQVFERWLQALLTKYRRRLLPVTAEVAEEWGRMNVPDPLPVVDGLLAATAKIHDLTLVTRNRSDVERTGVRLLDPFTWPA